jgi:hypothetical protein
MSWHDWGWADRAPRVPAHLVRQSAPPDPRGQGGLQGARGGECRAHISGALKPSMQEQRVTLLYLCHSQEYKDYPTFLSILKSTHEYLDSLAAPVSANNKPAEPAVN